MLMSHLTTEGMLGILNHTGLENHKKQGGACRYKQLREFNYKGVRNSVQNPRTLGIL